MDVVSSHGIVVRSYQVGEDRWFKIFLRELGLASVVADKSKLSQYPALESAAPLDRLDLRLIPRPRGSGLRLLESFPLERYFWLAADLESWADVILFLELVDRLSAEEDPQPQIYDLLLVYLDKLKAGSNKAAASAWALLRLLSLLGYGITLDACLVCGRPPQAKNRFIFPRGGFVHEACGPGSEAGLRISPGTLRYLDRLGGAGVTAAARLSGDKKVRAESRALWESCFNYLCQRRLSAQIFRAKTVGGSEDRPVKTYKRPRA